MNHELYIVEGSSAVSTLRQAVKGGSGQQVWSMQGKLPNVARFSDAKVMANTRCRELMAKLSGAGHKRHVRTGDRHDLAAGLEIEQSATTGWDNIYIVSDADIDGQHATVLLLAIVERFMPELILNGHLHVIMTPLYRIQARDHWHYAYNEQERMDITSDYDENITLTRFKSVAQLSADECRRFVLSPTERRSVQLTMDEQSPSRRPA